jgi:hypothetical protein
MDWRTENRIIQLEQLLDRACDLLKEHGCCCDPLDGRPCSEVREFLEGAELREALT